MWTNALAFVVAFGALFVKVWRLYKIFFNRSMIKRVSANNVILMAIYRDVLIPVLVPNIKYYLMAFKMTVILRIDMPWNKSYSECNDQCRY